MRMERTNHGFVSSPCCAEEAAPQGRLKIFFGYAAGVGKTYAMLEAAHQAKKRALMWWWAMWNPTQDRTHWPC